MKYVVVLSLLGVLSCGRTSAPSSGSDGVIGQVRTLAVAPAAPADATAVSEICQALLQKEAMVSTLLNTTHRYVALQTNCDGTTQSLEEVSVTIQQDGGDVVFRRASNLAFLFPQLETTRSGVLAGVCATATNLVNPIVTDSEALFFTTSGIRAADCLPGAGERCILLERALIQGTTATVHTREWLRIVTNANQGRLGFYNLRRRVSRSFCPLNQSILQSATLK
jgi:hypothetical protein